MKLLDCTLRDGGYYTNWDFDRSLVDIYIDSFNHLPVDYLEIGYRSNPQKEYLGEYFYCPLYVMERLRDQSNKKLAIILNEKDIRVSDAEDLLNPCKGLIDLIRIAVNPANFSRALQLGEKIKTLGFDVSFNVMYMSDWETYPDMLAQLQDVNGIVDYLYLVDSFGGVLPEDVRKMISLVKSKTEVKLGYHGHNNIELALANTLVAIEEEIDIVDGTVLGMGRGAGNLKMELLLTVMNSKGIVDFPYNELSKVVDAFSTLQQTYLWGTNLPYMVSGANSLPQKQVMEWVTKRFYSFNSIIRALNNQSEGKEDNTKLPELNFSVEKPYSSAMIIAGGPTPVNHADSIKSFLSANPDMLLIHASSKNALAYKDVPNDQYFCLVGNEGHRLENVFKNEEVNGKGILPPFPRTMGTYIPTAMNGKAYELKEVNFTDKYKDSHTALALQSIIELGIKKVYLTGYDGYEKNITQKEQDLYLENEYMFSLAKAVDIEMISLTPTNYTGIKHRSVYAALTETKR